ncbi:MAG TPA: TIGR00730 family Rossman fold protein [Bacteroidales bacterium]|nr:TIGR00730 family Rossman fold protein [Bacteroidales bacterium]HOK99753.1 TIGR00730 family Rossman fold protein [Bacteroidales bacterium]HPO66712.1 TIGR00730 family Rossman fold protein [Bacteroidales bacterium]
MEAVGVFCSSSSRTPAPYLDDAYRLGALLAKEKITVYYGGGAIGAMGALADGVLAENGLIVGVIPHFMMQLEWGNPRVTEMIVTRNLSERKTIIFEKTRGIIVLPGGTGTLDELAEALSHKKLGLFDIPVVVLNTLNFFDPLLMFLQRMVDEAFILPEHMNFIQVAQTPEAAVEYLKNYQPLGKDTLRNMAAL